MSCSSRCDEFACARARPIRDLSFLASISAGTRTALGQICRPQPGCLARALPRTIAFHPNADGYALYDPSEYHATARGASAAVLVACAIFRRTKISGTEAHDAHAGSAHGV